MRDYEPHRCDFCPGTVCPFTTRGESIRAGDKVVLVEGAVIGKCDRCGHRYWPADILKRVERAAEHPSEASRPVTIPLVAA